MCTYSMFVFCGSPFSGRYPTTFYCKWNIQTESSLLVTIYTQTKLVLENASSQFKTVEVYLSIRSEDLQPPTVENSQHFHLMSWSASSQGIRAVCQSKPRASQGVKISNPLKRGILKISNPLHPVDGSEIWLTSWCGSFCPLFTGFHTRWVLQDSFQQQYVYFLVGNQWISGSNGKNTCSDHAKRCTAVGMCDIWLGQWTLTSKFKLDVLCPEVIFFSKLSQRFWIDYYIIYHPQN